MKTNPTLLYLLPLLVISMGCSTLKRYSVIKKSGIDNTLAHIEIFGRSLSKAKPETGSKTLWDLSADAQSQFIKILSNRYPDNDDFIRALNFEYLPGEDEQVPDDYVLKDMRLIFSVSKRREYSSDPLSGDPRLSPADRIEYLKITLTIPDSLPLKFKDWNMYSTEYGSIDIADVSFSRSLDLNASTTLPGRKEGTEVTTEGKSTVSRKEDQSIKYRYLKLNGRISDKMLEMEEEGTREIDLTGNIISDISLEFDKGREILTRITGMRDSTGKFKDPEELIIQHSLAVIPKMENIIDSVYGFLKMDYIYRNVLNHSRTFPEWDDQIKYYSGSVSKKVLLFTDGDYVPAFYCIGFVNDTGKREIIHLESPGNRSYPLVFRTSDEASAFYEWMVQYSGEARGKEEILKIGGEALKFADSSRSKGLLKDRSKIMVLPYK